jgi:CubicO group peptidase (beta-lactamase class C family)
VGARTQLATFLATTCLILSACGAPDEDPEASRSERMSEAVQGMLATDSEYDVVRVVEVVADGKTLVKHYSGTTPEDYHPVQSVTKSVLSTLIGVAVADGLLSLDDTLKQMLPEYAKQMTPQVARVTLRDLLTMRGGFIEEERPRGDDFAFAPDAVAAVLATGQGVSKEFGYSNAGAHLISAVLVQATGSSVLDYARKVLFDPLGIDTDPAAEPVYGPAARVPFLRPGFAWIVDRQGIHMGWAFLKLRPADMLSLGQLYLRRGQWEGEQVVPETWIDDATKSQVRVDEEFAYGYLWWVTNVADHEAFLAYGYGNQIILVVPDLDLVAITVTELTLDDGQLTSTSDPLTMLRFLATAIEATYSEQ